MQKAAAEVTKKYKKQDCWLQYLSKMIIQVTGAFSENVASVIYIPFATKQLLKKMFICREFVVNT